ncbi:hypothetical protein BJV74DRAFT_770768 [Russula compacta]|nr:hypothetical protein BJV74DRAFT_770768 [Russula compacta]
MSPPIAVQHRGQDFLTYGYISNTFSPRVAEYYIASLFRVHPAAIQAYSLGLQGCNGAYFVLNQPMNYGLPPVQANGQHYWLLDYAVRPGGSIVPQQLWIPQGQGDWRRYVEQAQLHMPVFFVNTNGTLGVPVVNAAAGQMSLRGANAPAPLGDKTTTKIRISWPGYGPSEQQVQLRDQTPYRNPISLERFVKHLGSRVQQFLLHMPVHDPNSRWIVGHGRITFNEVMIIGVVQVSEGSWMPILQLVNRVVM